MTTNSSYNLYNVDDFIKDEFFQQWVYFPDTKNTAFWQDFLSTHPGQKEKVEEAVRFLRLMDFNEEDVFESKINALKKRIDFSIDHPDRIPAMNEPLVQSINKRWNVRPWLKVAAVLALFVLATFLVDTTYFNDARLTGFLAISEQVTDRGERTMISLEDGTKIWLNVDSKIRYPETFTDKEIREVVLDGEAFFEVAENPEKPFIVTTEGIRVKVLGTTFNVKSYENDDEIQTALIAGKVEIESMDEHQNTVTLAPNQMATYDKGTKRIVLNNQTDMEKLAGWKEGRLIFENKPLSEIIIALERWYDVSIQVEDQNSLQCHFSAKIENLSLREVLELFKVSDGIDYKIVDDEITIKGAICEN